MGFQMEPVSTESKKIVNEYASELIQNRADGVVGPVNTAPTRCYRKSSDPARGRTAWRPRKRCRRGVFRPGEGSGARVLAEEPTPLSSVETKGRTSTAVIGRDRKEAKYVFDGAATVRDSHCCT